VTLDAFARAIVDLGRTAHAQVGADDARAMRRLKWLSRAAEAAGRLGLLLGREPFSWLAGVGALAFHLSLEAQLNHTVMHGAYDGLSADFDSRTYETLALPLQSRTWGDAHRIHHAHPSIVGLDPDTIHPLFRVHASTRWRPWHALNTFIGTLFVFETWGFDYDRFLKARGLRDARDRGELRKLLFFFLYQYALWALLGGARMLLACALAVLVRNVVFVLLQTASSVGANVSTLHATALRKLPRGEWHRFQVESSKDFRCPGLWTVLCGGLDKHIEHHLYPRLPPHRLRALAPRVRDLCAAAGVRHEEHASWMASLGDSFGWLWRLSRP
jgi:linoleoyl-CoA desaturase